MIIRFLLLFVFIASHSYSLVRLGVDVFFSEGMIEGIKGKRIGLVTNHTGVNRELVFTYELFLKQREKAPLVALFSPEHGFFGQKGAAVDCKDLMLLRNIPIFSLYGATRRPTSEMLQGVDVLVYDIQDVGCRPYTYTTTLFYVMEEAAKRKIPVIVLDRPNPLGGLLTDGPMLEEGVRSFIGYIDVPYCHGMTIGELARYFNEEYKIQCDLQVIPMKGWSRNMSFRDTGLFWIPTSPYIPEPETPLFYATTGLIGELGILNIGIGYTLPFKIVGAPWIHAEEFARKLNQQKLPGVRFVPFYFKPIYGLYKEEECQGVLIVVVDVSLVKPVRVQQFILGVVKSMYPQKIEEQLAALPDLKKKLFCQAAGGGQMFSIFQTERYPAWKMVEHHRDKRELFLEKRKKHLLY